MTEPPRPAIALAAAPLLLLPACTSPADGARAEIECIAAAPGSG